MLAKVNSAEQKRNKDSVNSQLESYAGVLDKMIKQEWIDLDTTQQTISRLKRKGNRELADKIAKMGDLPKSKKVIVASAKPNKEKPADVVVSSLPISRKDLNKETKEAIHGVDNMISSRFLHEGSSRANSVCRISTYPDRIPKGTGFMISPKVVMTNHHVISDAESAKGFILEFDYYANKDGEKIMTTEFFLAPEELFVHSDQSEFDYAVIAVQETNDEGEQISDFGWNKLIEERGKVRIGEPLNIIHHPQGNPQKISIRQNYLVKLDEQSNRLDYMSDTMEGSSGAPVYNEEWEVVALHRASEVLKDQNVVVKFLQLIHNIDADLAKQMTKKTVKVNLGIRISVIIIILDLK